MNEGRQSVNGREQPSRRRFFAGFRPLLVVGLVALLLQPFGTVGMASSTTFRAIPTQFIAALGDPGARYGVGAETWGLWRQDPGPRGVWLRNYEKQLAGRDNVAPANWTFDEGDWWLDENGLIMEQPVFDLPPGKYIVHGERETMAVLTVYPEDEKGVRAWTLGNGARLYDVTHLPCRSARYTPVEADADCSPANADQDQFPVRPGGPMPAVSGCQKQDYAVLFIAAVAVDN